MNFSFCLFFSDESSLALIPDVVATGPDPASASTSAVNQEEQQQPTLAADLVDKSIVSSGPSSVSSIRIVSSMDKTPSAERDDAELCISEELNVTDDDDKGANERTNEFLSFFFF